MKIVVTGYPGLLSSDLVPILTTAGHEVLPLTIADLDITQKEAVFSAIQRLKPHVLINCAGYTAVDQAEREWEETFRVNTLGVHHLALACRRAGTVLCQISTDYVFDGRLGRPYQPWDAPNPLNVYGASKLAAERIIEGLLDRYYIVRTSSLYGKHGKNFVRTILDRAEQGRPLSIVCDQVMSPTWSVNLSQGILRLIESEMFGLYHLTDATEGGISWFEFGRTILKTAGLERKILPLNHCDLDRPAPRPIYSVLDIRYCTLVTGYRPLPFQEALKRFLT